MVIADFVILALVDGIADVLPIDSTAHAVLAARLLGWRTGSIAAAVHCGAALALLAFLWRDIGLIGRGVWRLRKRRLEPGAILLGKILLASLPLMIAVSAGVRDLGSMLALSVVGGLTIASALVMLLADQLCLTIKRIDHMGWGLALVIGLGQLLAIVPGIGRTAVALMIARVSGLERPDAFRFVLLVSIPYLLAVTWTDIQRTSGGGFRGSDGAAWATTFLLVLLAVQMTTLWLRRGSLLPFAAYRLLVGAALIAVNFV